MNKLVDHRDKIMQYLHVYLIITLLTLKFNAVSCAINS